MAFLNIWLLDVYKEHLHFYFIVKILIWILNFVSSLFYSYIKRELIESGLEAWTGLLAEDRDRWLPVVSMVFEIQVT
jgi:hypothetical membrane protein